MPAVYFTFKNIPAINRIFFNSCFFCCKTYKRLYKFFIIITVNSIWFTFYISFFKHWYYIFISGKIICYSNCWTKLCKILWLTSCDVFVIKQIFSWRCFDIVFIECNLNWFIKYCFICCISCTYIAYFLIPACKRMLINIFVSGILWVARFNNLITIF